MASIEEKIEKISKALRANKIFNLVNKEFLTTSKNHYEFDEAEQAAYKIVNDVEKLVEYGVNHGFTLKINNSISKLTNLVSELSDAKKLNKVQNIIQKQEDTMLRLDISQENTIKIKENCIEQIDDTIEGLEYYVKSLKSEFSQEIYSSLLEGLKGVKSNIQLCWDNYSLDAAKISNDIFATILNVRKEVSQGTLQKATVKNYLVQLNSLTSKWAKLESGKSKKAKEKDLKTLDLSGNQISFFYVATRSFMFMEKFELLEDKLKSFKEINEKSKQNLETYDNQIKEYQAKKSELLRDVRDIKEKLTNPKTKDSEVIILKKRYDSLASFFKSYEAKITEIQTKKLAEDSLYNAKSQIIMEIDGILSDIKLHEDNKFCLYSYYKNLEIESIMSVLNGIASKEQLNNAVVSIRMQKQIAINETKTFIAAADQFNRAVNELNNSLLDSIVEEQELDEKYNESQTVNVSREELLGQLADDFGGELEEMETSETETADIDAFDDLLNNR